MKKKAFSIFEIFNFERQSLNIRVIIISAVLFPVIGAVIRLVLLADLGMGTAFLTFYPMVMLAALYGGMRSGLIATSISTILSAYWMGTPNHRFNPQNSDFLGIGVFIISCFMISFISEAMIRAKKRLKERTAELIKARDQAEIANKAKSTFLASVSHELRTPLNSILGFSKILYNKTDISEENQKLIKIINRSGEHLLNLINDTLDMAKIEAGKVVVEYIPFNLRDLLRTVYDLMYERAGKKNIEFLFLVSEKVPNVIKGDYTKIRQILINLIGNAIKFTLEGGVYVEISIWEGQNESKLKIAIRDTGIGISQKNLEKIFEPFFQVADSAFQKGTGLGLAITKQFVELLGGELLVESNLHSGSTFTLLLPVEIITDTTELQADDDQHKNIKISNEEREIKVLLVDDEPENLLLLKSILDEAGFKVVCAENGPAGIEIFNSFNPEFIWMDWRMPEMDGAEAVKIIRKQKRRKRSKNWDCFRISLSGTKRRNTCIRF